MPALGAEIAKTFRRLRPGNVWLGWQDSNLRMPESKSGALPLGDIPMLTPTGESGKKRKWGG